MTPTEKLTELEKAVKDTAQASNNAYLREQELEAALKVARSRGVDAEQLCQDAIHRLDRFQLAAKETKRAENTDNASWAILDKSLEIRDQHIQIVKVARVNHQAACVKMEEAGAAYAEACSELANSLERGLMECESFVAIVNQHAFASQRYWDAINEVAPMQKKLFAADAVAKEYRAQAMNALFTYLYS